jgi:hypothetical protein
MVFQCARRCEHFGVSCLGDLFGFLAVPVQEVKLAAGSKGTEFLLNITHSLSPSLRKFSVVSGSGLSRSLIRILDVPE